MNSFTEKIKKGREKGITLRRNKFYNKAIRNYDKFNTETTESCDKIESAWRWVKVATVLLILTFVYSTYSAQKNYRLIGELNTEYKELIEMQIAAKESLAQANELIELVEENEQLDEEIKTLIDSLLEKNEVAELPDSEMKAMSAGLRLLEFMSEAQADDGNIYCPLCNRKI